MCIGLESFVVDKITVFGVKNGCINVLEKKKKQQQRETGFIICC